MNNANRPAVGAAAGVGAAASRGPRLNPETAESTGTGVRLVYRRGNAACLLPQDEAVKDQHVEPGAIEDPHRVRGTADNGLVEAIE